MGLGITLGLGLRDPPKRPVRTTVQLHGDYMRFHSGFLSERVERKLLVCCVMGSVRQIVQAHML